MRRSWGIAVLLAALIATVLVLSACSSASTQSSGSPEAQGSAAPSEAPAGEVSPAETPSSESPAAAPQGQTADVTELKIEDEVVGTGPEAKTGDVVTVHYTGWLTDGTKFDSSKDSGQPFTFQLGAGRVIPGWEQGVAGMKVGGVRRLTIPPDLGYGPQGYPPVIPQNATLVFEVEMVQIN